MVLRRFLAVAACLLPAPLAAQLPPLGVPGGAVRIEVHAGFGGATERFRDGEREDLGADLSGAPFGAAQLPLLAAPQARLASLTGIADYRASLGTALGYASNTRGFGALGVSLGVGGGLTIFGRVPVVNVANRRRQTITAAGDLGLNEADPLSGTDAGRAAAAGFFSTFDAALATLAANIAADAYAGDPARLQLAQETLARGTGLRDSLRALVSDPGTASPFLPVGGSVAGNALAARITSLQGTLTDGLGVSGFSAGLPLPAAAATGADLEALATDPDGPYRYDTFLGRKSLGLGDAEVGAVLTLVDGWDRRGLGGVRLAVEGLVRLPTGGTPSADDAWPGSTGDGQMDVEVTGVADVGTGRLGLRLTGGYQLQLANTMTVRVAPPGSVLVPVSQRAEVDMNPGDVLTLGATPFLRLARPLAAYASVTYRRRSEDVATFTGTPPAGLDASVLSEGTEWSTLSYAVGISYAEIGGRAGSLAKLPIDATWWWERVASGRDGRVAKTSVVRMQVRWYAQLW